MAAIPSIFEILRKSADPAADEALLSALRSVALPAASVIVDTILSRGHRQGLHGLIAVLHQLDPSLHPKLIASADTLYTALRESAGARDEQTRINVLRLIQQGSLHRAAYLLDNMFHDRSNTVRIAAAEVLCTLAEEMIQTTQNEATRATAQIATEHADLVSEMRQIEARRQDARQFLVAVESGMAAYELHRQPRVIEIAMWFVDALGGKFWTLTSVPTGRISQTAAKLFAAASSSPRMVPFAMGSLNYSQFRAQVATAVGQCTDANFIEAWLTECWRLTQPKTARAVSAIKELACLELQNRDAVRMSPPAQRFVPKWVIASGLPTNMKAEILRQFFRRADYQGQQAVIWALVGWPEPVAVDLLRMTITHSDAKLANMARLELARRRPIDFPLDLLIEESSARFTNIAAVASLPPGGVTFETYWSMFDQLDEAQRMAMGREVMESSPAIGTRLRGYLNGFEAYQRVRALRMIAFLNLAEEFLGQAYQLSRDPNPEVRSAATLVLAKIPSNTSRRILQQALHDENSRVQANAVEALEQTGHDGTAAALLPKLTSSDNRVRANAVKALLKLGVREAAETLLRMLADDDRAMRVSALWLIERMGLFALTSRVQCLAANDEDVHVRQRAQTLVATMPGLTAATENSNQSQAVPAEVSL